MPRIGILCGRSGEREAIRYSIEILAAREGFDCSVYCLDGPGGMGQDPMKPESSGAAGTGQGIMEPESSGAAGTGQGIMEPGNRGQGSAGAEGLGQECREPELCISDFSCMVLCHRVRNTAFAWAEKLWRQEPSLPIIYVAHRAEDIFAALGMPFFHTVRYFELEQDLKAALHKQRRMKGPEPGRIGFTRNGQMMLIPSREILYLESEHHEIRLHLGEAVFQVKETLAQCEERLRGRGFVRTDRSYLVNMYHMRSLERENVLLDNGERLYVSRRRYPEVKLAFENYIRHLDFI